MDIKSKKYSLAGKVLALILIIAALCYVVKVLSDLKEPVKQIGSFRDLSAQNYSESQEYNLRLGLVIKDLRTLLLYRSEQNILAGNTITSNDLESEIMTMFYNRQNILVDRFYNEGIFDITQKMLWDRFHADYKPSLDEIKEVLIQRHLKEYLNTVNALENTPWLQYHINIDGHVISNSDLSVINNSEYPIYSGQDQNQEWTSAFDEQYINELNASFLADKYEATILIVKGSTGLLFLLLSLGYLVFAAGKKTAEPQGIHHLWVDKIYNEITLSLLFLFVTVVIACGAGIVFNLFHTIFLYVLLVGSVLLAVAFLLILVRHIKSRTLLKHTLIFTLFHRLYRSVKKVFDVGTPMVKALTLVAAMGLLTAVPFMFLLTLPLALFFVYKQVIKFLAVKKGIHSIKNGRYQDKIAIQGTGEIALLAADINDISAGISTEVERRLKSERLKTELIINVSHDIKTPLTSVITYVDLLKKEDISSENAKEYIDVIAKKSNRLKVLIDDLFEASKAASGNIPVQYEDVDINALITQGLGELNDKINSSSLDFRINLTQARIMAYADGRLLWRVLENLLDNIFKYSLAQSRVYLDVSEDENDAVIELKNISAMELNISEDEVTDRFKRGDESRNSEGSGLGLDIAKSLMLCQNGKLIIKIDGDLFKAVLRIPKAQ